MLETLGIVDLDCHGTSFTGCDRARLATARLKGVPLVEWVLRRATESQLLDGVIAVMGPHTPEAVCERIPPDIPLHASVYKEPLARWVDVLQRFPSRSIVRIALASPFLDPDLIDQLVITARQHAECDYVAYRTHADQPAMPAHLGLFVEWCRAATLVQAAARRESPSVGSPSRGDDTAWSSSVSSTGATAHDLTITHYFDSCQQPYQMRLVPVPAALDRDDVRLAVDGQEDWEHAEQIMDALGPEDLQWQRIARLLDQQPGLRERMACLNREASLTH